MPTTNEKEERRKSYKKKCKNTSELRRRRVEVSMKIRKAKKAEQILKQRNVTSFDEEDCLFPEQQKAGAAPIMPMTFVDTDPGTSTIDRNVELELKPLGREMLLEERNPPIDEVIERGNIPLTVELLARDENSTLQFETACALSNIASGSSEQTKAVVEGGAIPAFIALLSSQHPQISEQAVSALGNIADAGPLYGDSLIKCNVVPTLLSPVTPQTPVGFLCKITWTLRNLCRNKNPHPPMEAVLQILPALIKLLHYDDKDMLSATCWAMSYLTNGSNDCIDVVVNTGIVERLVQLLASEELAILTSALRTIGNIVTGTDFQTQVAINCGVLSVLPQLLRHRKQSIQKEAAWVLSNIAAGPSQQIQQMINCGLLPPLVEVLSKGDLEAQKEAVCAVTNYTIGGTVEQVVQLVLCGVMAPLLNLLTCKDSKVTLAIFDAISKIFMAAEELGEVEKLCFLVEELGGLESIEALQTHENHMVYRAALALIKQYFSSEEDEDKDGVAGR
ncbi:importin subunit alpha-5-like [Lissotriton helveticus]